MDFDSVSEQWASYLGYVRSGPDNNLLALLLALACGRFPNPCRTHGLDWRRGSESVYEKSEFDLRIPDFTG